MKTITKKFLYSMIAISATQQTAHPFFDFLDNPEIQQILGIRGETDASGHDCAIYALHPGRGYPIRINSGMTEWNFHGHMIERRSWHGHIWGWSGRDRSFDKAAGSVTVKRGCTAAIYDQPHKEGSQIQLYNSNTSPNEYETYNHTI